MNAMKRLTVIMLCVGILLGGTSALAGGTIPNPVGEGETLTLSKIVTLVTDVINVFLGLAMVVTVGMIVFSGFKMATAGDETKKFGEGKTTLTHAVIGLAVILGVGIIVRTISRFAVSPTSILQ
jgi:hypothetical protein